MKEILCFVVIGSLFIAGCAGKSAQQDVQEISLDEELPPDPTSPVPQVDVVANPCSRRGSLMNFNDQRIVAFQKLVQLQILRIKSLPMTEESTQDLANLEPIRRRSTYPLLTSSLRPQKVSEILKREADLFAKFLEKRKQVDAQARSLYDEVVRRYIPTIDSQDHWNCLEKQTDFQEIAPENTE